jgi:hypothetical protein
MREFFRRLFCKHREGTLLAIEWDGVSVYRCRACKKVFRVPLRCPK